MTFRTLVPLATCAIAASLLASALAAAPPPAIVAPINGVIAAANGNDASKVGSYFTPDAVIIDEFSPYAWTGANAGARWWRDVVKNGAAHHVTSIRASVGTIVQFNVSGNSAYAVVPLTITLHGGGKRGRETGLWAMTLRRAGGTWDISSATWATVTSGH